MCHLGKVLGCGVALLMAVAAPAVFGAPVQYYTASGVGGMGSNNAGIWGNVDNTNKSAAHEVFIDYTSLVANETNPIILWEAGGSGTGSALVLNNGQLHFFTSNSNSFVVSGNHGLTVGQTGVQIVTAFELGAGTGDNELVSLYVNGNLIGTGDFATNNDWAGGESGSELGAEAGTQRYSGTGLFNPANVVSYPETDIDFAAYLLASSGGPADNTVANILVPEPGSFALLGLGGLLVARRRRR